METGPRLTCLIRQTGEARNGTCDPWFTNQASSLSTYTYTTAASISWISEWIMILANLNLNHHIQHRCLPQSFSLTLLTIFYLHSSIVWTFSIATYPGVVMELTPQAKFQFNLTYGLEDVVWSCLENFILNISVWNFLAILKLHVALIMAWYQSTKIRFNQIYGLQNVIEWSLLWSLVKFHFVLEMLLEVHVNRWQLPDDG